MALSSPRHVSLALGRLRLGVLLCCWAIGGALLVQTVGWSLATFTDLRFEKVMEGPQAAPLVVTSQETRRRSMQPARRGAPTRAATTDSKPRPLSGFDRILRHLFTAAEAVGKLAPVVLLLLSGVGVILAAGSATLGVEKTVSAFSWAIVLSLLTLPLGSALSLPWAEGAICSYTFLIEQAESARKDPGGFRVSFFIRFMLLPLTCMGGAGLVAWRFCAGVAAAMLPPEHHFDPELERETSGIEVTSLHAGRSARALSKVVGKKVTKRPMPSARKVSPGQTPKRII